MTDGENASQPGGAAGGPSVGVIGLGDIGAGVAASVAAAGLPLAVCDVRDEATDRFAESATVRRRPPSWRRSPT